MNPVTIPLACMSVLRLGWSRCGEKVVHARAVFAQPYYQSPDSQSVRANKSRGNISPRPLLEGEGVRCARQRFLEIPKIPSPSRRGQGEDGVRLNRGTKGVRS